MLFFFTFSKKVYALGIFYLVWQIIDAEEVWSNSCFCLFSTMIPGSQTSTYLIISGPRKGWGWLSGVGWWTLPTGLRPCSGERSSSSWFLLGWTWENTWRSCHLYMFRTVDSPGQDWPIGHRFWQIRNYFSEKSGARQTLVHRRLDRNVFSSCLQSRNSFHKFHMRCLG